VKISTPTATIAVRGTDFTMTIDEIGSSTIILLPSCNIQGKCYVGEISVESDAGQVIMNQAFQATVVDTVASRPMKPVVLNLDESMINNLLIISKPREIVQQMSNSEYNAVANALDIDFLEFDDLEKNALEEEVEGWATGLDIDFLEQNFLVDILDQINKELAKAMRNEFDKRRGTGDLKFGRDPETGITLLDDNDAYVWIREDEAGNYIELRLDKENTYILNVLQQDYEIIDYTIGGQGNEIRIQQTQ